MKTNYSILFIAGAIILLTSCAYDGISGSSGDSTADSTANSTAEIAGLWIQTQGATLTGRGASCGCRLRGREGGFLRRCFNYFGNGKVVSGYLKISGSYDNCDEPLNQELFNANKKELFSLIDNAIQGEAGSSRQRGVADFVPGNFKVVARGQEVTLQDGNPRQNGVYFNIDYPNGVIGKADLFIVCTAYTRGGNGNELFIAAEESGGSMNQPRDVERCNSARHTNLVRYTKYNR